MESRRRYRRKYMEKVKSFFMYNFVLYVKGFFIVLDGDNGVLGGDIFNINV